MFLAKPMLIPGEDLVFIKMLHNWVENYVFHQFCSDTSLGHRPVVCIYGFISFFKYSDNVG